MGLLKNVLLPNGVTVGYWKIIEAHYSVLDGQQVIKLAGYTSKEAKDAGCTPVTGVQLDLVNGFSEELTDGVLSASYFVVKQQEQFLDSTDEL